MRPRLRVALTVCAVVVHVDAARGGEPEAVRFSYKGAVGCPSESDFLADVALNGGLFVRVEAATVAREFAVSIEQGRPVVGRLAVRAGDGAEAARTERTIEGERCEDVARSLAVLMALALEPGASSPPAPPPPAVEPPRDSPTRGEESPAESAPPIDRWRIGASVEGNLSSGASPSVLPALAFYAEIAHDRASAFAPAVRLGFEITATGNSGAVNPRVTFSRRLARADVCPFRFVARSSWTNDAISADMCARLDAGVLEVTSTQAPAPTTPKDAWVAAGALVRVRWSFPVFFFLELNGGAVVPFVRERLYFEPSTQVFEIPPVAGVGGIDLGGYFL